MRPSSFLFSLILCGASLLHAATVYDITMTDATRYTQCKVMYNSSDTTKFSGTDKSGKYVTLEVKTSRILIMKEVPEKTADSTPTPAGAPDPAEGTETPTPAPEDAAAADGAASPAEGAAADDAAATQPAEGEAQPTEGEPTPNTAPEPDADKVKDVTLRLREKLARIDAELATLTNPSRSLLRLCESRKKMVENKLAELDKLALKVADLQSRYNTVKGADYTFTHVSVDDRDKYTRDGQAAYKAMLIDVKEYKNKRKVAGLDKFEILRERYQGIPEYKEAHKWYMNTLRNLEKRWGNLLKKEESKRSKLTSAKKIDMDERDEADFEKLSARLKAKGLEIAKVWFDPDDNNIRMLKAATNKVRDNLRRNEKGLQNEAIGTAPELLAQFWELMDRARDFMLRGDLEGAEELLNKDETFRKIIALNTNLLPNEYKEPLKAQRQDMINEIRKRARDRRRLQSELESTIGRLERATASAEAQIDAMLESIGKEKEVDTQSTEVEIEENKPGEAKPEESAQPGAQS